MFIRAFIGKIINHRVKIINYRVTEDTEKISQALVERRIFGKNSLP
jgi:hypothetical protein